MTKKKKKKEIMRARKRNTFINYIHFTLVM